MPAEVPADGPGRPKPGKESPSGEGRDAREASPDPARPRDPENPASEADAIGRVKASTGEWQESAIAAGLVDEVLRRLRDDGQVSTDPLRSNGSATYNIAGNFNVSGRDQHIGRARVRPEAAKRVRRIAQDELEFVKDVYSRPAGITAAELVFQQRHIGILQGTRGSGLRTAAMWLAATYAKTDRVFFISPDRLLAALHSGELEKGAAYVAPGLDAGTAGRLTEFALDEIEAWTQDGGWLVITASSSVSLRHEISAASELVIDRIGRPDPVDVAGGHAARELGKLAAPEAVPADCIDRLSRWLGETGVTQWLQARPEPRLAAQAGRELARAALGDADPLATLRQLEDPQGQAADWFTAHQDPAARALMVAAAVLGGSSSISIADAAAALYDELKGFRVRHERQDFWTVLVEQPWLEIGKEQHPTPLGRLPVEVMRFRNPRIQTALLEHAWRRADGVRLAITPWLRSLGTAGTTEVKAKAAAAAGIVALWDFGYALDKVLLPWATSKNGDDRRAAALALSIPANDASFGDATWQLVLGWCASGSQLLSTAICALGGPLGAQEPETALTALRGVVLDHGWDWVPDVASSLVVLAFGGRSTAVLSALLDWTPRKPEAIAQERELRLIGLSCFLTCASAHAAEPGQALHPVLLGPSGAGLQSMACLWGRALDTKSIRSWALDQLRAWFELRDSRDEDDEYVLDIVRAIAGLDDRQRERLEYHCYHWANDTRQPSKTAREALALLRRQDAPEVEASQIT